MDDFVFEFITPIIKVTKGKESIAFYTIPEYENWRATDGQVGNWKTKYYKGKNSTFIVFSYF